ncbi:hypothetical protein HmCmsJML130_02310 [Escherichia coli]|nr:hypothetical protein HmCmsJML130_02310 [Escherichia coli]
MLHELVHRSGYEKRLRRAREASGYLLMLRASQVWAA